MIDDRDETRRDERNDEHVNGARCSVNPTAAHATATTNDGVGDAIYVHGGVFSCFSRWKKNAWNGRGRRAARRLGGPKSMFPGVGERLVTRFRHAMMCTSIIHRLLCPACRVGGTRQGAASRRRGGKLKARTQPRRRDFRSRRRVPRTERSDTTDTARY